jgi:ABC-type uncharacterized transport system permease subunit
LHLFELHDEEAHGEQVRRASPFSPWLSTLAHPAMVAVKKTNNAEALSGLDLLMVCSFMFN